MSHTDTGAHRTAEPLDIDALRNEQVIEHNGYWDAIDYVYTLPPTQRLDTMAAKFPTCFSLSKKYPDLKAVLADIAANAKRGSTIEASWKAISGGLSMRRLYELRKKANLPPRRSPR